MNKRRVFTFAFLLLFGVIPLLNSLNNPRLSGMRGADRIQLMASGLCFGMAFGVLLGGRKFSGEV